MKNPEWTSKGKTVAGLIKKLLSGSRNGGKDISRRGCYFTANFFGRQVQWKYVVLQNCQDIPTPIRHRDEA